MVKKVVINKKTALIKTRTIYIKYTTGSRKKLTGGGVLYIYDKGMGRYEIDSCNEKLKDVLEILKKVKL